jgi:hypothetical protein
MTSMIKKIILTHLSLLNDQRFTVNVHGHALLHLLITLCHLRPWQNKALALCGCEQLETMRPQNWDVEQIFDHKVTAETQ